MRKRLSHLDWELIYEALQMLESDYLDGHPDQARLEDLLEYVDNLRER
jgi:hypothetical protein